MSDARFTEFDARHVELLPARTVLTALTVDGWGGEAWFGDRGGVEVGFNVNFGDDANGDV